MTNDFILKEEWEDTEGHDRNPYDGSWMWPYPTIYKRSLLIRSLRDRVIKKIPTIEPEDAIYLIEREESGGYSEFTQETDYYLEVWVHQPNGQKQLVWDTLDYSQSNAIQRFLDWTE